MRIRQRSDSGSETETLVICIVHIYFALLPLVCTAHCGLEICDTNILSISKIQNIRVSRLCLSVYIEIGSYNQIKAGSTLQALVESNYPDRPLFPSVVTISLPQGSPISLVRFTVYVAEIHEVEEQVEWCRDIHFVEDIT